MLPTELIGSIPRPDDLLRAIADHAAGRLDDEALEARYQDAVRTTIEALEETGSPVVTDGEQRKYHNFATYAVHGAPNLAPDGFRLVFTGHYQQFPRITSGPLVYQRRADTFLRAAQAVARVPVKQAVIAPSALTLLYPAEELPDYPREQFLADILDQHEAEVRACLDAGAHVVQVDFTEGRLACKLDPGGALLDRFVTLNNLALNRFSPEERARIGIHTCPGGDRDSTHSGDVDYAELLPTLFHLNAGNFYIALARETDPDRVLRLIGRYRRPGQRIFIGVIDVLDPRVETPAEVRDRVLRAVRHIPAELLGTTDDCGFSPFADDRSTSRDTAFAKIRARVEGTRLAAAEIAGRLG